jgi:hypothetical protein
MLDHLVALIKEYQSRVQEAASLLREYKGLANPMYWRQDDIPREGFLDSERTIEYRFHGIGCWMKLPEGEINWDFGYDGRLDGFREWFLWQYAEYGTKNFPEFRDQKALERTFAEAKSKGLIQRSYLSLQDDLYYLRINST